MLHSIFSDPQVHQQVQAAGVAIVTLVSTILVRVLYLAGNLLVTRVKVEHNALYGMIAERLVQFAEQKFDDNANQQKADYVAAQLSAKFPSLPPADVQHLVEAAVLNVKTQLAQAKAAPLGGTPQ